jgi:hypothetical protein
VLSAPASASGSSAVLIASYKAEPFAYASTVLDRQVPAATDRLARTDRPTITATIRPMTTTAPTSHHSQAGAGWDAWASVGEALGCATGTLGL